MFNFLINVVSSPVLGEGNAVSLSDLLTAITTVITTAAAQIPVLLNGILASPVFQVSIGIFFMGACIGLAGRLLSTR